MSNERQECTVENPYTKEKGGRWFHPQAVEIDQSDGYPSGDLVYCECPVCDLKFSYELSQ